MSKILLIFLPFYLFVSCNKSQDNIVSEKSLSDSLAYYMTYANNNKSDLNKQITALDKSFFLLNKLKNNQRNRDTLFSLMLNYYSLKHWDKFKKSSQKLLINSKLVNDSISIAKVYRYKGGYFKRLEIYDSSFIYYLKAEKLYIKLGDQLNLANNLLNKGIVQYSINDYLGSELSLSKAYYIFNNSNEKEKLYGTLNQLGLVNTDLKEYDRAEQYHTKALQTVIEFKLQNQNHQEAVCYNNLGYLFLKQKRYNDAIKNFNFGLVDKTTILDDADLYSNLLDNLGYSKLKLKEYVNVQKLFQNSLKIRDSLKNTRAVIASFAHLSEYYEAIDDTTYSILYSKKALQLAKTSKNPFDIVFALKQAAAVDKKNASRYINDYARIGDSLQDVERKNKDRFARIQLETDELIKENSFLTEKNQQFIYFLLVMGSIFSLLFVVRAQRARAKYLLLEQSQQKANEEIYRMIISEQDNVEQGKNSEKKRISKELHDGILGRMFGLRLNLDGLNSRKDENVAQDRTSYLKELKLIEQDIREISHELGREQRELLNNFIGITNVLFTNQRKINKAVLDVKFEDNIDWDFLSNTTRINIYRVLQESLQNCNKYAKAKNINVSFEKDDKGNLILSIFDDGIGFDSTEQTKGIGISNILERVKESEGRVVLNSSKNKGTSYLITIPFKNKQ